MLREVVHLKEKKKRFHALQTTGLVTSEPRAVKTINIKITVVPYQIITWTIHPKMVAWVIMRNNSAWVIVTRFISQENEENNNKCCTTKIIHFIN